MSAVARDVAAGPGRAPRAVRALASSRLTLAGFAALACGALVAAYVEVPAAWPLAAPLLLLSLNLAAAIAVKPAFRREPALLAFHVALLALVALAAAGRLTYLKGTLELSTGQAFDGELTQSEAGPLHPRHLDAIAFSNEGFSIAYSPGRNRDETRNRVRWSEGGLQREGEIGDRNPLELAGYRFYPTANKGFAPLVAWTAGDGRLQRGTVHLPSYPLFDYRQSQDWTPPQAASSVWLMLDFDEAIIDPAKPSEFRLPRQHALVVRQGGQRVVLAPGERVAIAGGVLAYEGLTTWMGYDVHYDWTPPWMLAAGVLAVAALGWHFARRFRKEPWDA